MGLLQKAFEWAGNTVWAAGNNQRVGVIIITDPTTNLLLTIISYELQSPPQPLPFRGGVRGGVCIFERRKMAARAPTLRYALSPSSRSPRHKQRRNKPHSHKHTLSITPNEKSLTCFQRQSGSSCCSVGCWPHCGWRSSAPHPHCMLGCGPMTKWMVPPRMMSEWRR